MFYHRVWQNGLPRLAACFLLLVTCLIIDGPVGEIAARRAVARQRLDVNVTVGRTSSVAPFHSLSTELTCSATGIGSALPNERTPYPKQVIPFLGITLAG